jgi:RHH-type rel operon transcriptional repressor/antitoxin RelB
LYALYYYNEIGGNMLAVRLPEYETRLKTLAIKTGRTRAFYVKELFQRHFPEIEENFLKIDSLDAIRNKETINAIRKIEKNKGVKGYKSTKELFASWRNK